METPRNVDEYNSILQETRANGQLVHVRKAELEDFYTDDFLPEGLVQLKITDNNGALLHFVFCEASCAHKVVSESEHGSYLSYPGEIFALLDKASPSRMLQTAERFLRDYS